MNKKMQVLLVALVALLLGFSPAMAKKQVPKVDNFIYFIDHSSSMAFSYKGQRYVQFGGVSKIMMAKSLARAMSIRQATASPGNAVLPRQVPG